MEERRQKGGREFPLPSGILNTPLPLCHDIAANTFDRAEISNLIFSRNTALLHTAERERLHVPECVSFLFSNQPLGPDSLLGNVIPGFDGCRHRRRLGGDGRLRSFPAHRRSVRRNRRSNPELLHLCRATHSTNLITNNHKMKSKQLACLNRLVSRSVG